MDGFEEYKFFAESAQYLSERRQDSSRTYLTVNTAIFTVLAFLVRDLQLQGWNLALFVLPLFLVGVLVCLTWLRIIRQYRALIGWRYEQLREMERELPDSHHTYVKEWERFYGPGAEEGGFGFSRLEAWLPILFLVLYGAYSAFLVLAALRGWW